MGRDSCSHMAIGRGSQPLTRLQFERHFKILMLQSVAKHSPFVLVVR